MSRHALVKLIGCIVALSFAWGVHAATPQVQNLTAKQRFPWNGLVDITCKVTGISGTAKWEFTLAAVMPDTGNVRTISKFWVVKDGKNSSDHEVRANGDYHLLWDARADLGAVVYNNMVMRVTVDRARGKVQLWDGGPYWATANIGAEEPWEYGYYFWWGDTVGYKRVNNAWVASDGSSSNFSFSDSNTPTYNKSIATLKSEGWITADEVLALKHDAAHVHWGGNWRMPTYKELSDLNSKCSWNWTTMNGATGWLVRGTGNYASNSIFLPCAGCGYGTSLLYAGSHGHYWSSVPDSDFDYGAWRLYSDSSDHDTYDLYRYFGLPVRPVQGFTE